jgi:chitodextrinase
MTVTYDGTTLTYYVDGALGNFNSGPTITDPGLNLSTLTAIGLAGGSPWPDNSIKGQVRDFRIYGQALSPGQVGVIFGLGSDANNSAISNALVPPSSFVWNGGGANNNWSTALNWAGGTAPGTSGSILTFAGSTRPTPNLDATFSVNGLTVSNNASSFTFGTANSSTLTLVGDFVNNSANLQTIDVPLSIGGAVTLNAAAEMWW